MPNESSPGGFIDSTYYHMTATLHTGVWMADRVLDVNEGVPGEYH
jgi:hypothetical protein